MISHQVVIILLKVFLCIKSEYNNTSKSGNYIEGQLHNMQGKQYRYGENWPFKYETCSGNRQSPININTSKTKKLSSSRNFVFSSAYRSSPKKMHLVIKNNSLHLGFYYGEKSVPSVQGTGLPGIYKLNHVAFYWGQYHDRGTGHSIDNKFRHLEVHLVHINSKYKNFAESLKHHDGVFIYTSLYKLEDSEGTAGIELLSVNFPKYAKQKGNKKYKIPVFPIGWLTSGFESYFLYHGSITYPPCSEAVTWMISSHIRNINPQQLYRFRKLYKKHEGLKHNIRHQQPWHGRTIYSKK